MCFVICSLFVSVILLIVCFELFVLWVCCFGLILMCCGLAEWFCFACYVVWVCLLLCFVVVVVVAVYICFPVECGLDWIDYV